MGVGTGGRGRVQAGRVSRFHDPFASVSTVLEIPPVKPAV